ncbi:MliC family protein [Vibrio europaeus]|uniref:MliC family protein n=1 Tax=Vibrio europaeus TaxID=300876 RepID=A0AAE7AWX9_9VIBR|nr:MliC family protein [Vibrio europaeus]MDC5807535.1 MliC family protein [Vibrio europaeus]MDC5810816.1 MliC family protein [Vibrio europaeus]MDC5824665.1 MliC family protein [Vibrio europaeus]MDC5828287.1 MliC family protein [Vibrio europaeus]MDC5836414.1 MliC family protein [Vibrio europaeus]
MRNRLLFAVALGLSVSACSFTSMERENHYQGDFLFYQCSGGETFKLALMPNDYTALLRLPKKDYRMIQVPSGSGTKYILHDGTAEIQNPVTLYTKGKEARLELGHLVYKNCITQ